MAERRLQKLAAALANRPGAIPSTISPRRKRDASRPPPEAPAPKYRTPRRAAPRATTPAGPEEEDGDKEGGEEDGEHKEGGEGSSDARHVGEQRPRHPSLHGALDQADDAPSDATGHAGNAGAMEDPLDLAKHIQEQLLQGQLLAHSAMHYYLEHFLTFPSFAAHYDLGNIPKDASSWTVGPPTPRPGVTVHVALLNVDCHWLVLVLQDEQNTVLVLDPKPGAAPSLAVVVEKFAMAFTKGRDGPRARIQLCTSLPRQRREDGQNCGIYALVFLFYLVKHEFRVSADFSIPNYNHALWRYLLHRYWTPSASSQTWIEERMAAAKACRSEPVEASPTRLADRKRCVDAAERLLVEASEVMQLSSDLDAATSRAFEQSDALFGDAEAARQPLHEAEAHAVARVGELLQGAPPSSSARKMLGQAYERYWQLYASHAERERARAQSVHVSTARFMERAVDFHAGAWASLQQAQRDVQKQVAAMEEEERKAERTAERKAERTAERKAERGAERKAERKAERGAERKAMATQGRSRSACVMQ